MTQSLPLWVLIVVTNILPCGTGLQLSAIKKGKGVDLPRLPPEGDGLINALGSLLRLGILVLSPRMEPPVRDEEGSTACVCVGVYICHVKLENKRKTTWAVKVL